MNLKNIQQMKDDCVIDDIELDSSSLTTTLTTFKIFRTIIK